jgi:hypothetical protein
MNGAHDTHNKGVNGERRPRFPVLAMLSLQFLAMLLRHHATPSPWVPASTAYNPVEAAGLQGCGFRAGRDACVGTRGEDRECLDPLSMAALFLLRGSPTYYRLDSWLLKCKVDTSKSELGMTVCFWHFFGEHCHTAYALSRCIRFFEWNSENRIHAAVMREHGLLDIIVRA